MWDNVLAFGDTTISRQELLGRFEQFVEDFPESEHTARAQETVMILRQMVKEDKEYAKRVESLEATTLDQRTADLIFQLRDQNGHQWSQPGYCDIFSDERGEDSPAHQLVKIGYPAIPQLITALDDRRLTRSVGYHRNFYFSHHVLRVGDAALAIIERIAGRGFCRRYSTTSEAVKDGEIPSVRVEVEAWWHEFQAKGEKQMLIEAVEAGDHNSPSQACLLVTKYPDAAFEAIAKGIHNAENWWIHSELVTVVAKLEGETSVPLLLSIVGSGPYLSSRVAAAEGLHQHGHPDGVAAMMREWTEPGESDPDEFRSQEQLVKFLVACGGPEALRTLGKNLHEQPVNIRIEVILALYRKRSFAHGSCTDSTSLSENSYEPSEMASAIEELLVWALDDTEEDIGRGIYLDDKEFPTPRVCDLAGHELAQRWPDRYEFDIEDSLAERNRKLIELQNVWRMARGLVPLSHQPEIPRIPDDVINELVDRIIQSSTEESQEATKELEALGLGALPAIRALLDDMEENDPVRPVVTELAVRLANTIQEVLIDSNSVEPDQLLTEQIETLKGKPLTAEDMVGLLLSVTRNLPPGSTGIEIRADRVGDDTGVTLSMRLIKAIPQTSPGKRWGYTIHIIVGDEPVMMQSGSGSYERSQTDETYEWLAKALSESLKSPPEEAVRLRLSIGREH
jgi:hypothetical protein